LTAVLQYNDHFYQWRREYELLKAFVVNPLLFSRGNQPSSSLAEFEKRARPNLSGGSDTVPDRLIALLHSDTTNNPRLHHDGPIAPRGEVSP
jgi:hypothetical protein